MTDPEAPGKILSLSRARKSRARDAARKQATANTALHGRTRAEKAADRARDAFAQGKLDQHRLDEE